MSEEWCLISDRPPDLPQPLNKIQCVCRVRKVGLAHLRLSRRLCHPCFVRKGSSLKQLSPLAEYGGNDTLQQAGNPLLILSWNIHTIRKLASEFFRCLSIFSILFFYKTIFAFARDSYRLDKLGAFFFLSDRWWGACKFSNGDYVKYIQFPVVPC